MPRSPWRLRASPAPIWRPRLRRRLAGGAVTPVIEPATVVQEGFRWRNDDGDEDGATWLAAQDTNASLELDAGSGTITYESSTVTSYGTRTNTTVTAPSGIANGDILILGIYTLNPAGDAVDPTPPAGFTLVGTPADRSEGAQNFEGRLFLKVASSESGDYTMTHASSISQGFALRYSGVDTTTPLDTTSTTNTGDDGATASATGLTTATNNAMLVFTSFGWDGSAGMSPPSGMTERIDSVILYVADAVQASAGASGNKSHAITDTSGASPWGAMLVALRPASVASTARLRVLLDSTGDPDPAAYTLYHRKKVDPIAFGAAIGTGAGDGSEALTIAMTTTATVPAGGFIVVGVSHYNPGVTVSCSSGGLTWTTDSVHAQTVGDASRRISILSAQAPAGLASGTVLTFNYSGNAYGRACWAAYWTGIATTSPKDANSGNNGNNTPAWAAASFTTTNANDLIVCASFGDFSTVTSTPATDYIEVHDFANGAGNSTQQMVYRIVSTTGSWTPGGTFASGTPTWAAGAVAYKAADPEEWLPVPVGAGGAGGIIGHNAIAGSSVGSNAGYNDECFVSDAKTYVASEGDVVTQFAVYGDSSMSAATPGFAIYVISGGVPTTRVGSIVPITVGASLGWHTASASIPLTAGVRYGVAVDYETAGFIDEHWNLYYGSGPGGTQTSNEAPSNALGSTWVQAGTGTNVISFYATVTGAENPVYIAPSTNIAASGEATTAQLTAPAGKTTGDFSTGRMWDDENGTDLVDIGVTAAFAPTDITGCQLWLDADDASTFTFSSGSLISNLADKSGNGNHFFESVVAQQPFRVTSVLNGKAVIRFVTDDWLRASTAFHSAWTAGDLYVVIKGDAADTSGNGFHINWTASGNESHYPFVDNNVYDGWGTTVRKTVGDPTPSLDAWRLYNVRTASGAWSAHLDGTQIFTTASNTVGFGSTSPTIGLRECDIAEFIVYDNVIGSGDRADLHAYIADKYGLTIA